MKDELTNQEIDRLALAACEMIGFESGATVAYDVAGYDRCRREERAPASLPVRDADPAPHHPTPAATFADAPYPVRVAGFRRRQIFGPDQIGALFRRHAIPWNDGLGNGLYESLRIDRKYGLKHVLEAPILGYEAPFLEEEWAAFRTFYPREVLRFMADLLEVEAIYGGPLARHGDRMLVLWTRDYPLSHFVRAYRRAPDQVGALLEAATGRALPPADATEPEDRLALTRFWSFVRRQHGRLVRYQADVLRQLMGAGLKIVANPHELPPLEMEAQAAAYDYPAVAIRPLLLDDELFLRHYIAYFTQFYHDLTGTPPMVSVRMNLSAATPQFVPTENLMRRWYNQAVRHGAGAFYFWTRDYPTDAEPSTYDGPIPGNPVAATLPQERWQASLDILRHLATHKRFQVPPAEVGILIPWDSALLHRPAWRRLYSTFTACAEAGIHTRFVDDRQIARAGVPSGLRMLLVPVLEFVSSELRRRLDAFADAGGHLLVHGGALWNAEGQRAPSLAGAEALSEECFNLFPPGESGGVKEVTAAAAWVRERVEREGIDDVGWLFDVTLASLPPSPLAPLREPDRDLVFDPWLYEHGSEWIMPYL